MPHQLQQAAVNKHKSHGFTLIEIMVVVLIIAIVMGMAALRLGILKGPRQSINAAYLLQDAIPAIRTQALLEPAVLGIFIEKKGFSVRRLTYDSRKKKPTWRRLYNDRLSNLNAWQGDVSVHWTSDKKKTTSQPSNNPTPTPAVTILPSGLIAPAGIFEIKWRKQITHRLYLTIGGTMSLDKAPKKPNATGDTTNNPQNRADAAT